MLAFAADALAKPAITTWVDDVRPMDVDQSMLPVGVENIDEDDADNIMLAAEYVHNIYAYLKDLEVRPFLSLLPFIPPLAIP